MDTIRSRSSHMSGFTLIELLTSVAIVGLLAGIAIQGFSIYRRSAHKARIQISMRDLRTALEAGNNSRTSAGWQWTTSNIPGPVTNFDGPALIPGFVNSADQSIHAWYSGDCDSGLQGNWCAVESASVWSCKSGMQSTYSRFYDGLEFNWEWQGPPWC